MNKIGNVRKFVIVENSRKIVGGGYPFDDKYYLDYQVYFMIMFEVDSFLGKLRELSRRRKSML